MAISIATGIPFQHLEDLDPIILATYLHILNERAERN